MSRWLASLRKTGRNDFCKWKEPLATTNVIYWLLNNHQLCLKYSVYPFIAISNSDRAHPIYLPSLTQMEIKIWLGDCGIRLPKQQRFSLTLDLFWPKLSLKTYSAPKHIFGSLISCYSLLSVINYGCMLELLEILKVQELNIQYFVKIH